jgi:hypothetical protein
VKHGGFPIIYPMPPCNVFDVFSHSIDHANLTLHEAETSKSIIIMMAIMYERNETRTASSMGSQVN